MAQLKIHIGDEAWVYDPALLTNKDVREVERFTGQLFSVFQESDMSVSDADHETVLVWAARRQNGEPDLAIDDVVYPYAQSWVELIEDPTDRPADGLDPTTTEDVPLSLPETGSETGSDA